MLIKVKKVTVPRVTIIIPCAYYRHGTEFISSVESAGIPRLVEEDRIIDRAMFTAIVDGEIRSGDLLGVINMFIPIMLTRYAERPKEVK